MVVAISDVLLHGPDEPPPARSGYDADNLLFAPLLEERQAISEVHGASFSCSTFFARSVDLVNF